MAGKVDSDEVTSLVKDTCVALLTTTGVLLSIMFGFISLNIPSNIIEIIRMPVTFSSLSFIMSLSFGLYLLFRLIGLAESRQQNMKEKKECEDEISGITQAAKWFSRLQFIFFVLGLFLLTFSVLLRIWN